MNKQLLNTLKENKLLKNIDTARLDFSGVNGELRSVKEGEIVYRSDEKIDSLFLIVSGEINIIMRDETGEIKSTMKAAGDFCGDEHLFDEKISESTAVAMSDCYLIAITKDEINSLIEQNPKILANINPDLVSESDESNLQPAEEVTSEDMNFYSNEKQEAIGSEPELITVEPSDSSADNPEIEPPLPTEKEDEADITPKPAEDELAKEVETFDLETLTPIEISVEEKELEPTVEGEQEEVSITEDTEQTNEVDIPADTEPTKVDEDLAVQVDLTEQVKAYESEQKRLLEKYKELDEAIHSLYSSIELNETVKNVLNAANKIAPAEKVTLYMLNRENRCEWKSVTGIDPTQLKLNVDNQFAREVYELGKILNIKDTEVKDEYYKGLASGEHTNSIVGVPIRDNENTIIAVLLLVNSRNDFFSDEDEATLSLLAKHAGQTILNAENSSVLIRNEKYQSIIKLGYYLSDELKTPLYNSKTYVESLISAIENEKSKNTLRSVDNYLTQTHVVLSRILQFTGQGERYYLIRRNLNSLIEKFIGRIELYLKDWGVTLTFKGGIDIDVKIDENEFYYCFFAIIKNASEAMPEGGEVIIKTERENNLIKIIFEDSGIGIESDNLEVVFDPFFSFGKENAAGLGLTLTRKIVESLGGNIFIESEPNTGTKVFVALPIAASL